MKMHPFARFIEVLAKGRNGMRSLTLDEARDAMRMISCYDVEPEQLGAFLMLMRVKEETADEVAGFTQALRESLPLPGLQVQASIDWAAYAGKKRQLPWFLLAALIVAKRGYRVFMHGMYRNDERIYVPEALDALDIDTAGSLAQAEHQLSTLGFSYLPISKLSPLTGQLIATRELFGLRSPLHTVARMLNPFSAPLSVMGVFHPNYAVIHQQAAQLLGQPAALICKGEGGEFERIPDRDVILYGLNRDGLWDERWDKLKETDASVKPERLNLNHFRAVWEGDVTDEYAEYAVPGTLALVLRALGLAQNSADAYRMGLEWWRERHLEHAVAREAV
ncbi:MAG: glycosyl transferase family protein [Candidatus Thiodiazotropha sp.]